MTVGQLISHLMTKNPEKEVFIGGERSLEFGCRKPLVVLDCYTGKIIGEDFTLRTVFSNERDLMNPKAIFIETGVVID